MRHVSFSEDEEEGEDVDGGVGKQNPICTIEVEFLGGVREVRRERCGWRGE